MRIGLTYNLKPDGAVGDRYEEFDSLQTIEALEGSLRSRGHHPIRLGWGMEMLDGIAAAHVDGVFNLAEGVGGRGRESQVPAVLEMLRIPCTGSDALAIGVTLDKALGKLMARAHGIATAPWVVVTTRQPDNPTTLRFPLFVKPAAEGSSMGITANSICRHQAELEQAVARVSAYGPVLVEEFLPGDEYTVGIVGGEVVGVMQVMPRLKEENFIYSLEVKRDYQRRVEYHLADAPDVAALALEVWKAFELRDVARVDIRRDRDGVANFVEVNPLPGVHPVNSDLVILAKAVGWTYDQLISGIMSSAEARWSA